MTHIECLQLTLEGIDLTSNESAVRLLCLRGADSTMTEVAVFRSGSDATALRLTAAVVRLRCNVLDRTDLEASGLQGTDRGLTA